MPISCLSGAQIERLTEVFDGVPALRFLTSFRNRHQIVGRVGEQDNNRFQEADTAAQLGIRILHELLKIQTFGE